MKIIISKHIPLYLSLIGIALSLFLVASVSAQSTEPTDPTPTDNSRMNGDQRMGTGTQAPAQNAERKSALRKNVQDRIINLGSNVTSRLQAGVARLQNITGRLETRIDKLKQSGIDTTNAEIKLSEAKNALFAAQDTLNELGSVSKAVSSESPRESFKTVRIQFIAVRDLLKQSHALIKETITLLKDAVEKGSTPTEAPSETPVIEN